MGNCLICKSKKEKMGTLDADISYLKDITLKDTIRFEFPDMYAKVVSVYDADTITVAFKLPYESSPIYNGKVRLYGIDAPEVKGSKEVVTEEEKQMGKQARDYLSNMLLGKIVRLEIDRSPNKEKWGRILAKVFYTDDNGSTEIDISEMLLEQRYVVPYFGKTKKKPVSWEKYKNTGEWD